MHIQRSIALTQTYANSYIQFQYNKVLFSLGMLRFWNSLNRMSVVLLLVSSFFNCTSTIHKRCLSDRQLYMLLHIRKNEEEEMVTSARKGGAEKLAKNETWLTQIARRTYKCDWFDITTKSNWIDLILFSLELAKLSLLWFHPPSFSFPLFLKAPLPPTSLSLSLSFHFFLSHYSFKCMHFSILHGCSINIE